MGIVRKQSIIGSVFVYTGAILGFITSGILFPNFLSPEQIGLLSLLVTYAVFFAQIGSLGFMQTITRMFPYFRNNEKQHNGFFTLILIVGFIGSIFMTIVFFIGKTYIVSNSAEGNSLFKTYSYLIIPLFISILFFNLFDTYTKVLYNAMRGVYQKEIILRIIILLFFFLYWHESISFHSFVHLYIFAYGVIMIYLLARLIGDHEFHLRKLNSEVFTKSMMKDIRSVSFYGLLISAAGFLVLNIDRIMLEKIIPENPLAQVGIYTTCSYFATLIILPSRPLLKISSVIIADSWKNKNLQSLQNIYKKSTINQSLIGTLVFVGLVLNIDSIFNILPETYAQGTWVIIFIGLFYLTDMFAGVNNSIIANSPHYRVLSTYIFIFIGLIIILNIIFIPLYGIVGAAFASFIAKILFHTFTYLYVRTKFKLQPYNYKHILVIISGLLAFIVANTIPEMTSIIANILIKSSVATIVFAIFSLLFSISKDVQEIFQIIIKKIK